MRQKKMRAIIAPVCLLIGLMFAVVIADDSTEGLSSSAKGNLPPALASSMIPQEIVKKEQVAVIPNEPDPDLVAQGGDDISSATPIGSLPFRDTGTTTGYNDDYDESCPWESLSPDVVYSYQAEADMIVCIDLCNGSEYDTKLFVYENDYTPGEPYACTDDDCPGFLSRLDDLFLAAGNTYYIVIDGYGGCHGNYVLDVFETLDCVICPYGSTPEGEPDCYDDYEDHFNGGCGSDPFVFGHISCGETVCGTSGTFMYGGSPMRDTDWYDFHMPVNGTVSITAKAEFFLEVVILEPGPETPCLGYEILYFDYVPICEEYSFEISLTAGDYWIWVAPEDFEGAACGSEYYLTVTCEGQNEVPTLTEWGMIILGLLLLATGTVAVGRKRRLARAVGR
jgi:hypothetical protein